MRIKIPDFRDGSCKYTQEATTSDIWKAKEITVE